MPIHRSKFNCMEDGEGKIFSIKNKMIDIGLLLQCWWHSRLPLAGLLPLCLMEHASGMCIFTRHRRF